MKHYLGLVCASILLLQATHASAKIELFKGLRGTLESVYFIPKRGVGNNVQVSTISFLNPCADCIKQLGVNNETLVISEKGKLVDISYLIENKNYYADVIGYDKNSGIASRIKLIKPSAGAQQ